MKRLVLVFGLLTMFAVTGCGSAKDYAGTVGSCTASSVCTDYSFTGKMSTDPTADATAQAKASCTSDGGTYAATACSRTGATGTCAISSTAASGGESFTFVGTIVYGSAVNVATGQASCAAAHGTYNQL